MLINTYTLRYAWDVKTGRHILYTRTDNRLRTDNWHRVSPCAEAAPSFSVRKGPASCKIRRSPEWGTCLWKGLNFF